MTIVEMCVHMDCQGCERKIKKALYKLKGVDDVDIDMVRQKVTVTGYVDQKKVLKTVRKTGRTAVLWPYPYNSDYEYAHNYSQYHPSLSRRHEHETHCSSSSASSYNYRKHGYFDSSMYGYYQRPGYPVAEERAESMFSDENPHACSIM